MTLDEEASHSLKSYSYVRNKYGMAFHVLYMALILGTIFLISDAPLGRLKEYESSVYTFVCGIHLALFPLTLVLTFQPVFSPWPQAAAFVYFVHTVCIAMLLLITTNAIELLSGVVMVVLDFVMTISLIAGYESPLSFFLPFAARPDSRAEAADTGNSGPAYP